MAKLGDLGGFNSNIVSSNDDDDRSSYNEEDGEI